ncbi:MAG: ABC transporter substrate-binding protein [Alphaproteobacteria bacterium]|nr:ABC transporter substrate-binding protein [Alphaproteobacteria bacterium]
MTARAQWRLASRRGFLATSTAAASTLVLDALPSPARAAQDELRIAIGADIASADPDHYTAWNDYWVYGNVFEGLYAPDAQGNLAPALAQSHEVSGDGLTHTFTLREGVLFHNGDPVTAEDVVFSLKRSLDPATQNQRAALIGDNIVRFEAADARRFVVHLKAIDAETVAKLSLYWQVKPRKYIETVGDAGFARKPVGTGPYELLERQPNQFIRLRAFDRYWGAKPKTAEVTLRIVPEEQSRVAQVMAAEAQAATPISPVLAARLAKMPNLNLVRVPSLTNVVLFLNSRHEQLRKKAVRQAICFAIDKPAMLQSLMLGYAVPEELWCTSAQPGCSLDGVEPYTYDPVRAKRLLAEADFDFAKPLRFVGMAPGRVAASKETCEAIAESLKRVGIAVDLQIMEFGAWNALKTAKEKDPSIAMIYATAPDPSRDVAYKLLVNTRSDLATSWVFDAANDGMLARMNSFTDQAERTAFLNQILRHLHDEALLLPLWANDTLFVTSRNVVFDVPPYLAYTILADVALA